MFRIFELPALIEETIHLVPLLEPQRSFELKFDNLEMLQNYVSLCGLSKLVDVVGCGTSKIFTVLPSL